MNNSYYSLIEPFIDQYELIAMQNGDEGDSCNREGCFAICVRELYEQNKIILADYLLLRKRYWENVLKLKQGKGSLSRGLIPNNWVAQNKVMSRDQWIPSVIGCDSMDLKGSLKYLFFGHLLYRALLFTTNTCPNGEVANQPGYKWQLPDITVLNCWGLYIRAFNIWPLYPFLVLFDIQTLIQSLILIYNSYYNPTNTTDVPNQLNILIQARRKFPTPFSWLARKLLKYCKGGLQTQLDNYFSSSNGSPPLNKIYEAILPGFM